MDFVSQTYEAFHRLPAVWQLLTGLIALMWLDVATGIVAAGQQWRLSSAVGQKGITKKALILLGITTAAVVQLILDHLPVTSDFPSSLILSTVVGWYIIIELLSIVENFSRAGMAIPVITPLAKRFAEMAQTSGVIVTQVETGRAPDGGMKTTVVVQPPTATPAVSAPVEEAATDG